MRGCGSTAVVALFASGDSVIPPRRSPGAGAAGTAGAASARRNAYWPAEETLASSAAPPGGTVNDATARQPPAISSHRAATIGRPPGTLNVFGSDSVAADAKLTSCGVMSAAATGDQPGGSRPCNPCCEIGVSPSVVAVASAPAGSLSASAPLVTLPPSTAETLAALALNRVDRASNSSSAWSARIDVDLSVVVQPGFVIRTMPWPSAARRTHRPRASVVVVSAYSAPVASLPVNVTVAPPSGRLVKSSYTSPVTTPWPVEAVETTSVCAESVAWRFAKSVAIARSLRSVPGACAGARSTSTVYGGDVSVATLTPSTRNDTLATPTLS